MILRTDELFQYKGKATMVDGCFDPLHAGHLLYFKAAKKFGLPVVCNAASDEYISKKHAVLLSENERAALLDSLRDIDFVHINRTSTADILSRLAPRFFVKGDEFKGGIKEEEARVCKECGIDIVLTDTNMQSSSHLLGAFAKRHLEMNSASELEQFEEAFFQQKETPASHYEESYFLGTWRHDGNDYSIETRREKEGRNPALIRDVFQPKRALDFGCGPGALMYFLHELGVQCDGVDYSASCIPLAPEAVRGRIVAGSVTDVSLPDNSYDLVICREVLEHLTLAEIIKAIRNMCRISSRFIYCTTRFHKSPSSFLSVGDDKENDPAHITVLHQNFMRALFTMEGFRRRRDFEEKMDWLTKERVLVYERQRMAGIPMF